MKKMLNLSIPMLVLGAFALAGAQAFAEDMAGDTAADAADMTGDMLGGATGDTLGDTAVDTIEETHGAGTLAGVHHGRQGDPVLKPVHRHGTITLGKVKPGHAKGHGETEGGELRGVTHRAKPERSHHVTPRA